MISEGKDLFGFEKKQTPKKYDPENLPIDPIDGEILIESMISRKVRDIEAFSNFSNHIQWGRHPGAVQMVICPLGSFKSIIRKLQENLLGERVWVCKKIMPYKDMLNAKIYDEQYMSEIMFENIKKCEEEDIEPPSNDYSRLENLTLKIAGDARKESIKPEILVFRGVRMVEKNRHYNIHFECRGHGVEAPGSKRLEQFSIDMTYDPKTGMIRSFGYGIESPTRQHLWEIQPSEWDELFSPHQKEEEIVSCVCSAFSTY
jgi:hypothetical protein